MTDFSLAYLCPRLSRASGGLAASVPSLAHEIGRREGVEVRAFGVVDPDAPHDAAWWAPEVESFAPVAPAQFFGARGMLARLEEVSPDIVDVQGLWTYPSLLSLRYARRHRRPYIVTPRGMLDPWALRRSRLKKSAVRLLFEDSHLEGAACIRTTANLEAEQVREFGLKQAIAVVPNGVDIPDIQEPRSPNNRVKTLLFMSRIHPKKGLPILLDAWSELAQRFPEWQLLIAGPDEVGHTEAMRKKSAGLGLERIIWSGPVSGSDKTAMLADADLFVLPTHGENFGLVVAEALAHGVPVVTTRAAPWAGLETERCGWWIHLSPAQLIDALSAAMICPPEERQAMGMRGRKWMERDFGWSGIADRMIELYTWVRFGGTVPDFVYF